MKKLTMLLSIVSLISASALSARPASIDTQQSENTPYIKLPKNSIENHNITLLQSRLTNIENNMRIMRKDGFSGSKEYRILGKKRDALITRIQRLHAKSFY